MRRLLPAIAALAALAALIGVLRPGLAQAEDPAATTSSITVDGTGVAVAVPDRAQLAFGVESEGATAKTALQANGAEMRRVLDALRAAGARDLATQVVSLSPRYGDNQGIRAFVATNTVSATIAVARAGPLIDAAVDAGANQVSGPSLTSSARASLYRAALRNAVADARERAGVLAAAAAGTLGRITTIAETGAQPVPLVERAAASDSSTPIEPGPQEITATVSVTFELR
jgi:uncharacterized protein YggE